MGKTRGPYKEDYQVGSRVRVIGRKELERFRKAWSYHHPLKEKQLEYAGQIAIVQEVSFYHGGDELYALEGIPGIWHEACLEPDGED
jgi:hypothetical protein